MKRQRSRIDEEKYIIAQMIQLYCIKRHGRKGLCDECAALKEYACVRLERCPYGERKDACKRCTTHCYAKKYKEQIKRVMRFSGPRMLLHHPVMAVQHVLQRLPGYIQLGEGHSFEKKR